ncbi:MAG: M4 family metallopeptidase [Bacteroidota bacterium]
MRYFYLFSLLLGSLSLIAQKPILTPVDESERHTIDEIRQSLNSEVLPLPDRTIRAANEASLRTISILPTNGMIERYQAQPHAQTGLPDWVRLWGEGLNSGEPEEQLQAWLEALTSAWDLQKVDEEFITTSVETEDNNMEHILLQQHYQGVPIYGNELRAHFKNDRLYLLNGRVTPTPNVETEPTVAAVQAEALVKQEVKRHARVKHFSNQELLLLGEEQIQTELVVFYAGESFQEPHLAWSVTIVPNLAARWQYMIDAHTGAVLREHDHICHLMPPPEVTTAQDLFGINRTIHSFETGGQNFLIDASRPMFNSQASDIPDDPVGAIWTINGNNTSPANDDFVVTHNTSPGNFWNDPLAVSAHYNAGESYRYFLETFNRNSINGNGGTVVSLINITEDDGSDMDNAFWNGQAMFYGNGNTAFTSPLAKALDVAGHEISHGVVQNTSNLEYQGESGALNESFADIFGAMIDRDDWQMGEDVVNPSIFPSGALRDLSNPNNGGSSLGDPGWQPAHTNEQFFGSADNGGVHINSGIPNRAFFLFASSVGRDRAEQVFYRALTTYLTRSSQFLDLRAAVTQSAQDLYGQTEVNAAINAFNTVGIGSGTSGGTVDDNQDDLEVNPGEEFILHTTDGNSDLFIRRANDLTLIADPLTSSDPTSKPSITDDGSLIIFVNASSQIEAINIDWSIPEASSFLLSSNTIWRNAAISRDGRRLAALTTDNDNRIFVFDLTINPAPLQEYVLTNPTTSSDGGVTGDVQFADILEWDHSGEFLIYDAFNSIPNQNGSTIDYWDIGFIRVWDRNTGNFGDGFINKLFSALPENSSVGNPTFSKNSPYIVALDFLEAGSSNATLLAANIETGEVGEVFVNARLNYPNYSNQDDQIIFDAEEDSFGNKIIGVVDMNDDKITPSGGAFIFIDNGFAGARWGNWFANGQRVLVSTLDPTSDDTWAQVFPTVSNGVLNVAWELSEKADVQLELVDMAGRSLFQQNWSNSFGTQREAFELDVAAGSYLLKLRAGDRSFNQLIVIQ